MKQINEKKRERFTYNCHDQFHYNYAYESMILWQERQNLGNVNATLDEIYWIVLLLHNKFTLNYTHTFFYKSTHIYINVYILFG